MKVVVKNLGISWNKWTDALTHAPQYRVLFRTGPIHFHESILPVSNTLLKKTIIFPASYFYPMNLGEENKLSAEEIEELCSKPEVLAIHYWAKLWHGKKGMVNKKHFKSSDDKRR